MSYTKHNFETGQRLYASQLNEIDDQIAENEDSIADAQGMIATVETTATASKAYAVGDLLVYDGKLCKVTSVIAAGATIIVGSNVEQTTVVDQIASGDEKDVYPKMVFSQTIDNNYHKINVSAINYETGVITLAENTAPFTNDYNTTLMVWCVPLIEGVMETYKWGFMPPELYAINYSQNNRGVLVGNNQIKLYTSANVSIESITETTNVNFSRFQIWATDKMSSYPHATFTGLDPNHRYRFVISAPTGGECACQFQNKNGLQYGQAYGFGYTATGATVNTGNYQLSYVAQYNSYETLSFRGVKHFGMDSKLFDPFPKFMIFELSRVSDGFWCTNGSAVCCAWDNKNFSTISDTDRFVFATNSLCAVLNSEPASVAFYLNSCSGGSFAPLDGHIVVIYDLGEAWNS